MHREATSNREICTKINLHVGSGIYDLILGAPFNLFEPYLENDNNDIFLINSGENLKRAMLKASNTGQGTG